MNRDDVAVPISACPHCGSTVDAATPAGPEEVRPKPGDVSLCFRCAGLMVFDDALVLCPLTDPEWNELDENFRMELYKLRVKIRRFWRSECGSREAQE